MRHLTTLPFMLVAKFKLLKLGDLGGCLQNRPAKSPKISVNRYLDDKEFPQQNE